ncbi:MAG: CidA/LrgA family protein [Pseudomonadota bacterium]
MLAMLTLIFSCQLVGELVVVTFGLTVPGPVLGMLLLFVGLMVRGSTPASLGAAADGLLSNLSLLFVPAGVGVMLHASLLSKQWLPLSVAVFFSTLVTVVVTGWLMQRLGRRAPASTAE